MKYSAIAFVALMSVAGFASAKTTYVTGDIKSIDKENHKISIIEESGDVKAYKVKPAVVRKMRSYKEGDSVTLTLKTVKTKS